MVSSQQGTRAADATATTAGLAGLPKFACNGQGQSAADLLRAFLAIQTHRAELYATFHTGFKRFLETRQEAQYNQLLKHLTALFSACSQRVIELEAQLKVGGHAEYAGMLRTVQEGERDKLRLTLSLQALKQAHAFKSFSWQQEGADTGIGGSAHEACCHHHHHAMQALSISSNNDISTSTSRGTTAAPAPDAHQQADCHHDHDQQPGHSHSTHEHGHGHGHGHCHGGHEHSACGTAAAAAAAAAASEPTEWEYNAAVAEATRDLNSAIVAINDALEEVRYALAEEEEQQEQGPADGMES